MANDPRVGRTPRSEGPLSPSVREDDAAYDRTLRPRRFDDYIGQEALVDNLRVFVTAARQRGEAVDHILFCAPRASARPRSPTSSPRRWRLRSSSPRGRPSSAGAISPAS